MRNTLVALLMAGSLLACKDMGTSIQPDENSKVYRALVTDTTSFPHPFTIQVLENTLGDVQWERFHPNVLTEGVYFIKSPDSLFDKQKTSYSIKGEGDISIEYVDKGRLVVFTKKNGNLADNVFYNTEVNIEVKR